MNDNPLTSDESSGEGDNFEFSCELIARTTYILKVFSWNNETMDYTLQIVPPEPVDLTYLDEHGDQQSEENYTVIDSATTAWESGWYAAEGEVNLSDRVTVTGDVNLVLKNGAVLTAAKGVGIPAGASLTIYGQTNTEAAMGQLIATSDNYYSDGIGRTNGEDGVGAITIVGGKINATGKNSGAGIAGYETAILGGVVTALGGSSGGAGIGGGNQSYPSAVTISGGNVTATGGIGAAGIGCGSFSWNSSASSVVTITGGNVTALGTCENGVYKCAGICTGKRGTERAAIRLNWTALTDSVTLNGTHGNLVLAAPFVSGGSPVTEASLTDISSRMTITPLYRYETHCDLRIRRQYIRYHSGCGKQPGFPPRRSDKGRSQLPVLVRGQR